MVSQDGEMAGLQHVTNVTHRHVDRQVLPVVGTVFLLCRTQFPGEECEGLPDALHTLLEDGTHGGS